MGGNAVTAASMMLWATSFPVTVILFETWSAMLLTPLRCAVATLALLAIQAAAGRLGELRFVPWRDAMLLGGAGLGGATLLLMVSLERSDPVSVAVILSAVPLVSAVMGWLRGEERISTRLGLAIALVLGGGVLTNLKPAGEGFGFRGGELFLLAGVVLFTWYSRAAIRRLGMLSSLTKTSVTMGAATLALLPLAFLALAVDVIPGRWSFSARDIVLILWMAAIANGVSMAMWLAGARMLGVTIASMHQNLVPFYVMAIALGLGGDVAGAQLTGAVLVIAGAMLAQWPYGGRGGRPRRGRSLSAAGRTSRRDRAPV